MYEKQKEKEILICNSQNKVGLESFHSSIIFKISQMVLKISMMSGGSPFAIYYLYVKLLVCNYFDYVVQIFIR